MHRNNSWGKGAAGAGGVGGLHACAVTMVKWRRREATRMQRVATHEKPAVPTGGAANTPPREGAKRQLCNFSRRPVGCQTGRTVWVSQNPRKFSVARVWGSGWAGTLKGCRNAAPRNGSAVTGPPSSTAPPRQTKSSRPGCPRKSFSDGPGTREIRLRWRRGFSG